jgi:hypothetical protein
VKGGVKAYEIKVKCYGEHVGEHIGNQRKMKKNPFSPTPRKKFKGRKAKLLECMLGPSHWLHEVSIPKRVRHHFWPGLIPSAKNILLIKKHTHNCNEQPTYSLRVLIMLLLISELGTLTAIF